MKNANHYFGSNNGSENFYKHGLTGYRYTDGVRDMAEACKAYWLIDLILSHQCEGKVRKEPFQVWDFHRTEGYSFSVLCTDGNHNKVTTQSIEYSDFPYDLATVWLVDDCLLLPSEY